MGIHLIPLLIFQELKICFKGDFDLIYSIKGELIHTEASLAVIECGGVGYACRTTYQTLSQIGKTGGAVRLYTYLNVREDAVELFGFSTLQELNCFKMLTSVSGVGPKAGLAILSDNTPEKIALAVASSDSKAFTKTKGVGPKLAQRIVLELKDKITNEQLISSSDYSDISSEISGSAAGEAVSALAVLGFSQSEAASAVSKLDQSLPSSELIRLALKTMGQKKQ